MHLGSIGADIHDPADQSQISRYRHADGNAIASATIDGHAARDTRLIYGDHIRCQEVLFTQSAGVREEIGQPVIITGSFTQLEQFDLSARQLLFQLGYAFAQSTNVVKFFDGLID